MFDSRTNEREIVLAVDGLRVETTAGAAIVESATFSVAAGEVLGLVGESGCGKTTTALALLNYAREGTHITGGSVLLDGRNVLSLRNRSLRSVRGRLVSYVPQDPTAGLNPRHRVGAQIAEALIVHGTRRSQAWTATRELVSHVGLPQDDSFLTRYPFELSGGQQQRVAIAMALVTRPLVVVLDEPTTGLDVVTQSRVLETLRRLSREAQTAFVYVTHDLAVIDGIADHVAVMYAGRIVESGATDDLFWQPLHPYSRLLLQSVPRLRTRRHLVGIPGTAPPPGARPEGCFFAPRCPLADGRCVTTTPIRVEATNGHVVDCFHFDAELAPARPISASARPRELRQEILRVEGVTASYGVGIRKTEALHGVTFEMRAGDCVALVGESGSGKTTLGRCVVGLHKIDSGRIEFDGAELASTAARRTLEQRRAIQIVFQNPDRSLNPAHTVAESVLRPMQMFGRSRRGAERTQVAELLARVRLPAGAMNRYPRELSGGERQRVAIARALAADPKLIICDEITSALDVSIQAAVVELLGELRRDGLTLLFITHNLALVNSIADRVVVLESGFVRETGSARKVITQAAHPYTRTLLDAAPELREPEVVDTAQRQ